MWVLGLRGPWDSSRIPGVLGLSLLLQVCLDASQAPPPTLQDFITNLQPRVVRILREDLTLPLFLPENLLLTISLKSLVIHMELKPRSGGAE